MTDKEEKLISISSLANRYQVGFSTVYIYASKNGIEIVKNKKRGNLNCIRRADAKNIDVMELLRMDSYCPKITPEIVMLEHDIDRARLFYLIRKVSGRTKFGSRIFLTKKQVNWITDDHLKPITMYISDILRKVREDEKNDRKE